MSNEFSFPIYRTAEELAALRKLDGLTTVSATPAESVAFDPDGDDDDDDDDSTPIYCPVCTCKSHSLLAGHEPDCPLADKNQ